MKKAILAMTFGSPESYTFEGVAQFFTNIRRGVRPTDQEIEHLYQNYLKINGSPLQAISKETVRLLQERVGAEYQVYFANKFSAPLIPDVVRQMEQDGIEQCLCLILEPHYSVYSVMGYEQFLESKQIQFAVIQHWYQNESLLNFWVDEVSKIVQTISNESYQVVFSAHSVPLLALEFEDPYIDQIYENGRWIAARLGLEESQFTHTWQSESDIGLPWMKPDVLDYMRELPVDERPQHYIFVPISFISEHIEVLFDNDVECQELCQEQGVHYHRPPMPNTDARLIDALYETVKANEQLDYQYFHGEEAFDVMQPQEASQAILAEDAELKMPDFVKKLIEKKGRENVKIPRFVQKMLEKRGYRFKD